MRTGVGEIEFVHHTGGRKTMHPALIDERHSVLTCQDVWMTRDVNDNAAVVALSKELERVSSLRAQLPEEHPINAGLPIDHEYKYGIFRSIRFPVYACGNTAIAYPMSITDIQCLADTICKALSAIHDAGYIVWNMTPVSILEFKHDTTFKRHILSPYAILSLKPMSVLKELRTIMDGCTIISPYQVLVDMMNSKYESDEVELNEFKTKMKEFWTMVLHKNFKHVPDVCQFYHSQKSGMSDYLDTIIFRFCKTRRDPEHNKTFVIKDPNDLTRPILLKCIDWFALGVIIDSYLELLIQKDPMLTPPLKLTKLIQDCLCMNVKTRPYPLLASVRVEQHGEYHSE